MNSITSIGNPQTEWMQQSENNYVRECQKSMWSYIDEKYEKSEKIWRKRRMRKKHHIGEWYQKMMLYSAYIEKNKVENYLVKESLVG